MKDFERKVFDVHFLRTEITRSRVDVIAKLVSRQTGRVAEFNATVIGEEEVNLKKRIVNEN